MDGIDVKKLKPETVIEVGTLNNIYSITITGCENFVIVEGGKFLSTPKIARFIGSTYGGTAIRLGWLGYMMHMEIIVDDMILTTSRVKSIKIIGEDWYYDLNFSDKILH